VNERLNRWLASFFRRRAFHNLYHFVVTEARLTNSEHDELVTALDILRKYQ
jgi:hypothetical protein